MSIKRHSTNLLRVEAWDYYDLDAQGHPTPVVAATVTGQIFATQDTSTPIGGVVTMTPEVDQAKPNDYRGLSPASVGALLVDYDQVWVKYTVDAGGDYALSVSWVEEKVVDE